MKTVFADACFYITLLRRVDELHLKCVQWDRLYDGHFLTSEFTLIELGNCLAKTAQRPAIPEFIRRLRADSRTTILPHDPFWIAQGFDLYARRPDKQWSLTDCISFEMMRRHNLTDALSADHHFTQAGFNALLADSST